MKKSTLRKFYLKKQLALSKSEWSEKSLAIKERFFLQFNLTNVSLFHYFITIKEKGEIDTSVIRNELRAKSFSIKTIVPRVNFDKDELEHLEYDSKTVLKTNGWGIPEPTGNNLINEDEIDIVLVPMLCFDELGFRVGHGKGFYDKFLVRCRDDCLKIGLSMFDPIGEIEDVRDFDVKLDYCVTPEKVWEF